ncbi:MAG TPA: glycosyltransferase family 1 protein, partial [Burkholderiaceae bacterium]|nr:glycosyltransferase family 1 protein [Burkholderiaceae bacterium]
HGCVDTRLSRLIDVMRLLEADEALAREWGEAARNMARRRFGIERFVQDWNQTLLTLVGAVHE